MVSPARFSHSLFTSCLISSATALHAEHLSALNVVLTFFFLAASAPPRHSTQHSVTTAATTHHARWPATRRGRAPPSAAGADATRFIASAPRPLRTSWRGSRRAAAGAVAPRNSNRPRVPLTQGRLRGFTRTNFLSSCSQFQLASYKLGIANVRSLAGLQITIGSRSTLPGVRSCVCDT